MSEIFFHPKVVHIPMALGVLMPLIAGGLLLAWWRQWLPARAWFLAVGLQAALVLSGFAAMRSGEHDEERVEKVVDERYIEEHEEAAEAFVWTGAGVFALMLAAAVFSERRAGLPLAAAAAVGTLGVFGLGYRTGQEGGALVYQHGAAQVYASPDGASAAPGVAGGPERGRDHDKDSDN